MHTFHFEKPSTSTRDFCCLFLTDMKLVCHGYKNKTVNNNEQKKFSLIIYLLDRDLVDS